MSIWIAPKSCTTIPAHCFKRHGCRTHQQDYRIHFMIYLGVQYQVRGDKEETRMQEIKNLCLCILNIQGRQQICPEACTGHISGFCSATGLSVSTVWNHNILNKDPTNIYFVFTRLIIGQSNSSTCTNTWGTYSGYMATPCTPSWRKALAGPCRRCPLSVSVGSGWSP